MTTPRDDIARLSERLRKRSEPSEYSTGDVLGEEAAAAIDALQARVKELEGYRGLYEASKGAVIRERDRATRIQQERDEAYERAAKVALEHISEPGLSDNPAYINYQPSDMMARKIAAAIRRLARPEKEGE